MLGNGFNALFLTKVHNFSPVMAGSILSGAGILGGIAMLFIPAISDYLGRKPVIILCSIISGIFYLLFIFGDFSPAVMALIISISGIFGFGQMPLTVATIIAEAVPKRLHATAIGTSNFPSVIIGTLLMPMLGGWAADKWGLFCPLLIAAVAMLLIAVIMSIVPESAPRKVKTEKIASVEAAG
jgi:MFS family permease